MARKKKLIIPVFIPFAGCAHQCVFCDQNGITGQKKLPSKDEVENTINTHLSTWKRGGEIEVAFYGGSFTGLSIDEQSFYLGIISSYINRGLIHSIRVSTRPDYIDHERADFLSTHSVKTVELGVQSMSDEVLKLSGRNHTAAHTINAIRTLKEMGFITGVQIMPGLPGDTVETILMTAGELTKPSPDFARVYPTLVLKNTPLHRMFLRGEYRPWALEEMVDVCRQIAKIFEAASIPIIKFGLQPTDELRKNIMAGPFHPSFRQLL